MVGLGPPSPYSPSEVEEEEVVMSPSELAEPSSDPVEVSTSPAADSDPVEVATSPDPLDPDPTLEPDN